MTPPAPRFTAALALALLLGGCTRENRVFVVERQNEPPIELKALSYSLSTSGVTPCATFWEDIGWASVRQIATICNVHLVRPK